MPTEADKSATVTVSDVPIFAAGIWNGITIRDKDLDSMVRSFDSLQGRLAPPLKLGHDDTQNFAKASGLPAVGWISSLKRAGNQVVATFENVPRVIADLVRKRAYRFISPEVLPVYKLNGETHPWTLWAVALLGGEVPAIKSLGDISRLFNGQKPESENFSSQLMVLRFSDHQGALRMVFDGDENGKKPESASGRTADTEYHVAGPLSKIAAGEGFNRATIRNERIRKMASIFKETFEERSNVVKTRRKKMVGILKEERPNIFAAKVPTTTQTIILSKDKFTKSQAEKWIKDHDYKSEVDETSTSYRYRQRDPGDFKQSSFRTIEITDGASAVIGRLK